ncbi:TetR/AcrR family transcriptional regulator [Paenibacillus ginsengarvi]|uniref:TetR/AcrR family transcriptional regulator n=2 Tax=Paenibacillus ginsengarvi TaxID=400777 RepID=A0A3B0CM39_9BACL|nr:TetR/AcrR family transcriptional regulator C-terminal domain-containing protein [Paenibacillus ginsengarvi]RKN85941.1 TetR/AcrR family transcriptional regulator [Paenibacillus ginsengarvi]
MDSGDFTDAEAIHKLPPGVALSWGIVRQQRRGPKGELSVKKIVDAAIEIADRDGLAAVSMSRVAQSLGFTTMSLYRYITGKDDLLVLMQDAVSNIPIPPEEADKPWRQEMAEYAWACIDVFRKHPWYGDMPITSVPLTPGNLQVIDWMLRIMKPFPLTDFEKMSFLLLISSYARACGLIARDMERVIREGGSREAFTGAGYGEALRQLVKPDRFPHLHPVLMSGAYTDEAENPIGDDLDFGLERILDGIEHYMRQKTADK